MLRIAPFGSLLASTLIAIAAAWATAHAAERKPFEEVSLEALMTETQRVPDSGDPGHVVVGWWIPIEYWDIIFSQDPNVTDTVRRQIVSELSDIAIVAVVQADISPLGAFDFFGLDEVQANLRIVAERNGTLAELPLKTDVAFGVEAILNQVKPILANAMGNMGQNMHFFVVEDPRQGRVLDPYAQSAVRISVARRDGAAVTAEIVGPLDSLHVPRLCENGRPAHISWNYCPWSGKKLPD